MKLRAFRARTRGVRRAWEAAGRALLATSLQPGGRRSAPEPLELVQAFVNTVDADHGPDLFALSGGLGEWLGRRGLAVQRVSEGELGRAGELRESLRVLLLARTVDVARADVDAGLRALDAAGERAR